MAEENKIEEKKEEEKKKEETKEEAPKEVKIKETEAKEEKVEVPEKFKKLVEEIEKMSVLDLAELVKVLEKKFGVSAAAPVSTMAGISAGGAAQGATGGEEKTSFNVELTETGTNKIGVIKVIRAITQKGLKESKDIADNPPQIIKEGVKKEEAEEIKKKLEEVGAKVTLK